MRIAAKTGWPESHILWDLPLSRAYAYLHAAAIMDGEDTRWPAAPDPLAAWMDSVRRWTLGIAD